ncbi:MAG: periplasmic heavy metal sensor [Candidatus Aminicenantales bacterium]
MKSKDVRIVWLFLGIFAAVTVSGLAQWRRPGSWSYQGLNLTDDQLAKIQEVRLAFQEGLMPLRLEWEKAQMNLDRLLSQGADQKQMDAAMAELDKVEIDLEKAYQEHWNEVRNLLDEEQRVVFDRFGGLGLGLGWGANPRWGMRSGWGRGFGPGWGMGMRGYRPGWGQGMGPGYGRGWGPGLGRGYFCPWYRWR